MKTLFFGLLAAATLAIAMPASVQPADAQVSVQIGGGHRDGYRSRAPHRRDFRHHRRDRCFTERTRVRTPSGRIVVRTQRVCR